MYVFLYATAHLIPFWINKASVCLSVRNNTFWGKWQLDSHEHLATYENITVTMTTVGKDMVLKVRCCSAVA